MHKVIVSKKWNSPEIHAKVSDTELTLSMMLDEFLSSLVEEIGSPALILTKGQLLKKMEAASAKLLDEMKIASIHV